jgi:hypothetical protein
MLMIETRNSTVALRRARDDEADVVRRIADLDDAPTLQGDVLLALVDGEPVAALGLQDGRIVADPFEPTADAVALLRLRASHLSSRGRAKRRWTRLPLRPRLA